jgi:pyruvate dehydrogenase E2 component (dihydrolipoamide acetyltransferase)
MLHSKQSKPCFYIESKVDVTELMSLRHNLSKSAGVKITSNAFLIRALAIATEQYPMMIARVIERGTNGRQTAYLRIADAINVGFAVNAPQGLIVPVIKNADKKTLAQIATEEKTLTDKARSNKLKLEDIEGETIALSNLGAYGTDSFFGIVPPPASTILAAGNVLQTVAVEDEEIKVRKMVSVSLAVDRTVVCEDYAAKFLRTIKELIEEPERLAE